MNNDNETPTTQDRFLAGASQDDPESASDFHKERWLSVMMQLIKSHRFLQFIDKNYTIIDRIDPEEKTIETLVVESPIAMGPPLGSGQLHEIQMLIKLSGVKDPNGLFQKIMKLLGQSGPTIHLAP